MPDVSSGVAAPLCLPSIRSFISGSTLQFERGGKVIQLEKVYTSQTCAWCEGTGKRAVSIGYVISCLVCGGKGAVMMATPSGPCRNCQGRGRRNVTDACLTCAGTGWARVFEQA
jgi:DnaJ-class molecular chaperone